MDQEVKQYLDANFARMDARFERIDERFERIAERFAEVDRRARSVRRTPAWAHRKGRNQPARRLFWVGASDGNRVNGMTSTVMDYERLALAEQRISELERKRAS